jgi:hypothetical protein
MAERRKQGGRKAARDEGPSHGQPPFERTIRAGPTGPAIWQAQLEDGGARECCGAGARAAIGMAASGGARRATTVA